MDPTSESSVSIQVFDREVVPHLVQSFEESVSVVDAANVELRGFAVMIFSRIIAPARSVFVRFSMW